MRDSVVEHDLNTGRTRPRELTKQEQSTLDRERQSAAGAEAARQTAIDRRKQKLMVARQADRDTVLDTKTIAEAVGEPQGLIDILTALVVKIQRLEAEITGLRGLDL